jgi:hypothetical protein
MPETTGKNPSRAWHRVHELHFTLEEAHVLKDPTYQKAIDRLQGAEWTMDEISRSFPVFRRRLSGGTVLELRSDHDSGLWVLFHEIRDPAGGGAIQQPIAHWGTLIDAARGLVRDIDHALASAVLGRTS